VCGQPQHLLQVLQQTLPPQVFQLLVQKLPTVNQVTTSNVFLPVTGVVPVIKMTTSYSPITCVKITGSLAGTNN